MDAQGEPITCVPPRRPRLSRAATRSPGSKPLPGVGVVASALAAGAPELGRGADAACAQQVRPQRAVAARLQQRHLKRAHTHARSTARSSNSCCHKTPPEPCGRLSDVRGDNQGDHPLKAASPTLRLPMPCSPPSPRKKLYSGRSPGARSARSRTRRGAPRARPPPAHRPQRATQRPMPPPGLAAAHASVERERQEKKRQRGRDIDQYVQKQREIEIERKRIKTEAHMKRTEAGVGERV